VSYQAAIAGLKDAVETVDGLNLVLDYEPPSLTRLPAVYRLLDSFNRTQAGQVTVMRYRVLCRLCVRWQDNEKAEWELIPFVNSIPAAIDADPQLGGAITRGYASVAEDANANAGFVRIGGTMYRSLDVYVDIVDKDAYQSGI
jgi:hypothetical protein